MRNNFVLAILALIVLALCIGACSGPLVTSGNALVGSGKFATRDYALNGFTGIQANGGFQVTLTASDTFKVSVTADDNLFDMIDVRKDGSVLVVELKPGSVRSNKLDAAVALPTLASVSLNGGSSVSVGSASPKATTLTVNANGGSRADLGSIAADKVSVTLNGGAQANVNAKSSLDYDLNGGSTLRYTGKPTLGSAKAQGGAQAVQY